MKKLTLTVLLVLMVCGTAFGAQIFTTTIQNTTVQRVREVALPYMVGRNFAIDRVEDYTMTFTRGFGGFWVERRNMIIRFNVIQIGENVKLMVTQFEDSPEAGISGQRNIGHLIPLIREIRYSIDRTPLDQIVNEATNEQPQPSTPLVRSSGLTFDGLAISTVALGGLAEQAGLKPGDTILEINGRPADETMLRDIDARLADGRSVMIQYVRNGTRDLVTLR